MDDVSGADLAHRSADHQGHPQGAADVSEAVGVVAAQELLLLLKLIR